MKFLTFTDIHVHPHKKSVDRLNDCLKALNWVFETAISNKIQSIVFLGDLFHERQKIDVYTYQKTFEIFEKYVSKDLQFYALIGNHDLWHYEKWDISSVNPFRRLPGFNVIDKPEVRLIAGELPIGFLPYTHNPLEDEQTVRKQFKYSSRKILCGHLAIDGATLNYSGTKAEVSVEHDGDMTVVDANSFKWWDRVFLGHYHVAQELNKKIEYVGSPLELSFGEAFQKKHIMIYDSETDKRVYIENDFSPKHLIISEDEIGKYDLAGQFVRLEVTDISASSLLELRKNLVETQNVSSIEIKQAPKCEQHIVKDAKVILYDSEKMLEKYVDQVEIGNLDRKQLLEVGQQICTQELPSVSP